MKQIHVLQDGRETAQALEAFSWDAGKSYCSDPRATLAFLRRRKAALDIRLSEAELRWINQLDDDPEGITDRESFRLAVRHSR